MPKVFLMVGIQGVGKTTYAHKLSIEENASIVSSDCIRTAHPDWPETEIFPEVYRLTAEIYNKGENVVLDATNITEKVRARSINELKKYISDLNIVAVYITCNLETCIERVKKRNQMPEERFLPIEIISSYASHVTEPQLSEGFSEIIKIDTSEN